MGVSQLPHTPTRSPRVVIFRDATPGSRVSAIACPYVEHGNATTVTRQRLTTKAPADHRTEKAFEDDNLRALFHS